MRISVVGPIRQRGKILTDPLLASLAVPGTEIAVRVTPKASRNLVQVTDGHVRVYVTSAPDNGKANAAVQAVLAKALGIAKTRLVLIRGATSRDKVFRVD